MAAFILPSYDPEAKFQLVEKIVPVTGSQVAFQKFWERASLYVQAPFMVFLATRKGLHPVFRIACLISAGLIVYVDGGLLLRWKKLKA